MAAAEMDGSHRLTKDTQSLTNELQQMLHRIGNRNHLGKISPKSSIAYVRKVIRQVNGEYKKKIKIWPVKV